MMGVDLYLDPDTHDLVLDSTGQLVLVSEPELVAQRLKVRFNTHSGEWPLDITQGLPWRDDILIRNPDLSVISAAFRRLIQGTPGVIRILEFNLVFDEASRFLFCQFRAQVEDGVLVVDAQQAEAGAFVFNLIAGLEAGVISGAGVNFVSFGSI
jgi:hypothetical protein